MGSVLERLLSDAIHPGEPQSQDDPIENISHHERYKPVGNALSMIIRLTKNHVSDLGNFQGSQGSEIGNLIEKSYGYLISELDNILTEAIKDPIINYEIVVQAIREIRDSSSETQRFESYLSDKWKSYLGQLVETLDERCRSQPRYTDKMYRSLSKNLPYLISVIPLREMDSNNILTDMKKNALNAVVDQYLRQLIKKGDQGEELPKYHEKIHDFASEVGFGPEEIKNHIGSFKAQYDAAYSLRCKNMIKAYSKDLSKNKILMLSLELQLGPLKSMVIEARQKGVDLDRELQGFSQKFISYIDKNLREKPYDEELTSKKNLTSLFDTVERITGINHSYEKQYYLNVVTKKCIDAGVCADPLG